MMRLEYTIGLACAAALLHVWIWRRTRRLRLQGRARGTPPENTPIFLALFGATELSRWQPAWLLPFAAAFLAARFAQAIGTDARRPEAMRIGGAVASWVLLIALAALALLPLT